jgi:hypothetical protein
MSALTGSRPCPSCSTCHFGCHELPRYYKLSGHNLSPGVYQSYRVLRFFESFPPAIVFLGSFFTCRPIFPSFVYSLFRQSCHSALLCSSFSYSLWSILSDTCIQLRTSLALSSFLSHGIFRLSLSLSVYPSILLPSSPYSSPTSSIPPSSVTSHTFVRTWI